MVSFCARQAPELLCAAQAGGKRIVAVFLLQQTDNFVFVNLSVDPSWRYGAPGLGEDYAVRRAFSVYGDFRHPVAQVGRQICYQVLCSPGVSSRVR